VVFLDDLREQIEFAEAGSSYHDDEEEDVCSH
jgi:hypothetical protein